MRGVTKNLLNYRAGKQMWTLSTQKPQWCYPTFGGCWSLSEESRHPFVLGRVFVHSELYLTFLFTWKILCHLTRERELCIGSLVLTVTWHMLARQSTGIFVPSPTLWTESLVCYLKCMTFWSSPQLHLILLFDLIFPSFPFCVLCLLSYCIPNYCPPDSQLSPNFLSYFCT